MSQLTTDQMAQLLVGIARAQIAIADAIESSKAGFKSTHLRPNVESAARIKTNRRMSLEDLPSKLLLQMMGRIRMAAPETGFMGGRLPMAP